MTFFAAFRQSLFQAGGRRFAAAMGIALLMLGLLDVLLRFGGLQFIPAEYMLRNKNDDQAYVTRSLVQARFFPPDVTPLYIFGGSGMREAIISEEALNRLLGTAFKDRVYKTVLAPTSSRSLANEFATLDMIRHKPGVIIYGVDINRFVVNKQDFTDQVKGLGSMGRNKDFIDFLKENDPAVLPKNAILNWFSAHTYLVPMTRLVAEKLHLKFFKRINYQLHNYDERKPADELEKAIDKSEANIKATDIDGFSDITFSMFRRILRLAKAQGYKVLIVEQPMDYQYINGRFDAAFEAYRRNMNTLAKEEDVFYLDFERDLHLPSNVFADRAHLKDNGARLAYMNRLVKDMAVLPLQQENPE